MASSKDVAKLAGVSQSTVSRVLNTPSKVKPESLQRVLKAMKNLNYRPNLIARSLVQNRTEIIALISGHLHNPFFVDTTMSIVNKITEKGFKALVYFENQGDNMTLFESVLSYKVDGIILSSIFIEDPVYYELERTGIPFVMFNRKHRNSGNYVELDNEKATTLLVEHLLELNHRRIAYIGGPTNISTFLGRYQGFVKTLDRHGISLDEDLIKMTDTSEKSVAQATAELLKLSGSPTAILAATDSMAIFCMNYLLEQGVRIPEDVSLCGVDNIEITSHHAIQMTTAGHKSDKRMGDLAIERLLDMIEQNKENKKDDHPMQITLEPVLYPRKTTAPV